MGLFLYKLDMTKTVSKRDLQLVWCCIPEIPPLGELKQESFEGTASLGYICGTESVNIQSRINIYVKVKIMNRINPGKGKGEWRRRGMYQVYGVEGTLFRMLLANVF